LALHLELTARPLPPVFYWLKQAAKIENHELARTFNCGIGMLISVRPEDADNILRQILLTGEDCWIAGNIVERQNESVILGHVDSVWT
jgi:phosphoribosylformylglycinamidine cyclo-ligase